MARIRHGAVHNGQLLEKYDFHMNEITGVCTPFHREHVKCVTGGTESDRYE